ncbi:MAG: phospholipase D family protein [Geminicoccaceae bacterium]
MASAAQVEHEVRPLITASVAFAAFERLVFEARHDVFLAFRILDPTTRLRSDGARERGLDTWADLLADAVGRGIRVRLLLSDFDAVAANRLHRMTWQSVRGFRERIPRDADGDRFQVIAALHEGEFGSVVRAWMWPVVRHRTAKLVESWRQTEAGVEQKLGSSPGLWGTVTQKRERTRIAFWPPPRMWPATHHQKLLVADGESTILGGLDIDERRYDDPDHQREAETTWHDVSLEVRGAIAGDAERHFVDCWNREVPRFNSRLTQLGAPSPDLPDPVSPLENGSKGRPVDRPLPSDLSFVRTRSRRRFSPLAFGPRPEIMEIERACLDQIQDCQNLLYLETQFFRSGIIADALCQAARKTKTLHVILVLPAAPEDVVFYGHEGPGARHGEWLQVQAIDQLRQAFADRFAAFCLVRDVPGTEENERDAVDGRQITYLHSKVSIADGRWAIVSSANLNGRSLKWDTEAGAVWRDEEGVAAFQTALWSTHLRDGHTGEPARSAADALSMWRQAAEPDRWQGDRRPQIAAYPLARARAFARRYRSVPHNMV